jgi:cleavage stimulation factor subunit 2
MLMLGLVDASVLQHVIASTGQPATQVPMAQPVQPIPQPQPRVQAPVPLPANVDPQKLELMQQVMSLTPEQIDSLKPEQRAQIMLLRQQFMAGQL